MATAVLDSLAEHEFTEYSALSGAKLRVDTEKHVIHGVKILGGKSDNGRIYTDSAMLAAVTLYEGAKVNLGHQVKGERPYADRLGNIRNVEFREGGLYGDFHYNPKHPIVDQLLYDAEFAPGNVGFSPHHRGNSRNERGVQIVESITSVTSVDLVANPATTRTLYESKDIEMSEPITLDAVRKNEQVWKECVEAALAEHAMTESSAKEIAELREKLAAFEAKEAADAMRQTVLDEIKGAKLDPTNEREVSKVFLESLLATDDAEARKALIADRAEVLKASTKPKSVSQVLTESSDDPQTDAEAFAKRYGRTLRK